MSQAQKAVAFYIQWLIDNDYDLDAILEHVSY